MEMKDVLADLRDERGLKQKDIAQLLNVVVSTVSKYELGKSFPEHDGLVKLADYYQVNLDYLFGRTSIRMPMREMENRLTAPGGPIRLDIIPTLSEQDKELVRRLLESLAEKPEYQK